MKITMLPFITLLCAGLIMLACGSDETPKTQPATAEKEDCCAEEPDAKTPLTDTSIYQLDSDWTDQDGKDHKLRHYRGRPRVVAMIFTNCQYACPQTMATLKQIESRLPAAARNNTGFLLLSLDPARDTAKVLLDYSIRQELDLSRWTLLRSEAKNVREIAAVLGISYKQNVDGNIAHSNIITLLDDKGEIKYQLKGLGADPEPLLAAIRALVPKR